MTWTKDQEERFAANKARGEVLHAECKRREKLLNDYLNSNRVKKLKKDVQDANDALNMNIDVWNNIVMENHRPPERDDSGFSNTYTSVDGELRLNWKEDPKSW